MGVDIVELDDTDDVLDTPGLVINLDEVNNSALSRSTDIIEHLSGYYFDERYVREHPYIKNKITQEIDNIRRLLKMLAINEKAQDSLIQSITCNFGKSALYSASYINLCSTVSSSQSLLLGLWTITACWGLIFLIKFRVFSKVSCNE